MYPGEEFLLGKNPIREKFMISWKYIYPCQKVKIPYTPYLQKSSILIRIIEAISRESEWTMKKIVS